MSNSTERPSTLGELKASGYKPLPVKEEMRRNMLRTLKEKGELFPGIVGFEDSVEPQVVNAVLAKHDILLLGLRGQAKTRIARMLTRFLDEYIPVIGGSEINDDPFAPVSRHARDLIAEKGDDTPIEWVHRDERYGEKLATPDVSIADLIGDIDPIKVATQRLTFAHEGAIHFGIIPRTNRGIFVINELPDLQPRIQVGLFNIMQERDIQIRGFNVRIPLDVVIVFTANPQDYTNRGAIITPLKDRIDSQILTHYPRTLEDGIAITRQEAKFEDDVKTRLVVPEYLEQVVEMTAAHARSSEFVDQQAGVSTRMTISTMESMVANAERRAMLNDEAVIVPRVIDLQQAMTGITGKAELVFEGEQEGPVKVARALIGKAVRSVFSLYFPDPLQKNKRRGEDVQPQDDTYQGILAWFSSGNTLDLNDRMSLDEYFDELNKVPGLAKLTERHLELGESDKYGLAVGMEFVLEGLHQYSRLGKEEGNTEASYRDMVGSIFTGGISEYEDDEDEYDEY